jgi:hypothetical protein
MKTTLTALLLLLSGMVMGQMTIPPAKGDRASYYLIGDVWESSYNNKHSGFVLQTFRSHNHKSIWIQELSMGDHEMERLMKFISSLPKAEACCKTMVSKRGDNVWEISSFEIHGPDFYNVPIGEDTLPDIYYLMDNIRKFYNQ